MAWGGEVSKAHQLVTVLGLLFSIHYTTLHIWVPSHMHGFSYHCYSDDTLLYLSFQPDDPKAAWISDCLADISACIKTITYSSTCQRLSFLSSLPLQLFSMISLSSLINNYPINAKKTDLTDVESRFCPYF